MAKLVLIIVISILFSSNIFSQINPEIVEKPNLVKDVIKPSWETSLFSIEETFAKVVIAKYLEYGNCHIISKVDKEIYRC